MDDRILLNISSSSAQKSTLIKVFSTLSQSTLSLRFFAMSLHQQLILTVALVYSRSFAAGTNAWTATEVRREIDQILDDSLV